MKDDSLKVALLITFLILSPWIIYEVMNFIIRQGGYKMKVKCIDDKSIKEFDRLALISNDIVRHLITKIEKQK